MCGIAGIFSSAATRDTPSLEALAHRMSDALIHRGPDDHGLWTDAAHGLALAHRRLSILDLSPSGHQPMLSASGRYVVCYNGEIYNYRALRQQLTYPWRGSSDTEVLLAAIEAMGIERALAAINGMFAFALWDRQEATLTLARDRLGEKPLYYGWLNRDLVFSSELKSFAALPDWTPPEIDPESLHLLMRYSYVPAPRSIYKGIFKLPPATYITIKPGQAASTPRPYWSLHTLVQVETAKRFHGSDEEAIDLLDLQLKQTVGARMLSDVPLGAFLSGGIDSSLITALMQAQAQQPVKTFTIGFTEEAFNEAPYAKAVAHHLGTEHRELYVTPEEAAGIIPQLPTIYDEPFADASQIPTFLVSRFARGHVTVALSGDGGDELFGGYNRYRRGPALWNALSRVPHFLRQPAATGLGAFSPFLGKIGAASQEAFYDQLCATNPQAHYLMQQAPRQLNPHSPGDDLAYAEWMMREDAITYFPGDILTKVDRAAMAVSLETRTPFTDPELIALGWRLPLSMKIREGQGKWLLRQLLYRYVPTALVDRPKSGFAVPLGAWLRGALKPWASDLLSPAMLSAQGHFKPDAVHALWRRHQAGMGNWEKPLWNILMFQSWLNQSYKKVP